MRLGRKISYKHSIRLDGLKKKMFSKKIIFTNILIYFTVFEKDNFEKRNKI